MLMYSTFHNIFHMQFRSRNLCIFYAIVADISLPSLHPFVTTIEITILMHAVYSSFAGSRLSQSPVDLLQSLQSLNFELFFDLTFARRCFSGSTFVPAVAIFDYCKRRRRGSWWCRSPDCDHTGGRWQCSSACHRQEHKFAGASLSASRRTLWRLRPTLSCPRRVLWHHDCWCLSPGHTM